MEAHIDKTSATYQILDEYCQNILDKTGINIQTKGRTRDQADLIKIFCKHTRYNLKLGSNRIARFLNRTHASVLHACNAYDNLYTTNKDFQKKAEFFITRFDNIDGKSRKHPNREQVIEIANNSSEETCAKILEKIKPVIVKESIVEYETVSND